MTLDASGPNAEQIKYWNETAGPKWVALQQFIDEQIRPLGLLAMDKAKIAAGQQVLDIGCGCGDTTLEIARRVGAGGSVTGIDISTAMLEQARQAARAAKLDNVSVENADAQTAKLPPSRYDLLFSRFGVMFFIDAAAAFANLRKSLKPSGRLAFVCWRGVQDNPWMFVPVMAAAQHIVMPPPPAPGAPGPFSFAETERVSSILTKAGFADVSFAEVNETLTIGGKVKLEQTVEFLLQMGPTATIVRDSADSVRKNVAAAVLEAIRPYSTPEGVRMASGAWIVTARNQ